MLFSLAQRLIRLFIIVSYDPLVVDVRLQFHFISVLRSCPLAHFTRSPFHQHSIGRTKIFENFVSFKIPKKGHTFSVWKDVTSRNTYSNFHSHLRVFRKKEASTKNNNNLLEYAFFACVRVCVRLAREHQNEDENSIDWKVKCECGRWTHVCVFRYVHNIKRHGSHSHLRDLFIINIYLKFP